MRWLWIGLCFCGFSFALGFFLGGIDWTWRLADHTSAVAFWSMIGSWLSGFATFLAVIVSLWMAYQASQINVEKILIAVEPLRNEASCNAAFYTGVKVKNLKPIDTPLNQIMMEIDGATVDLTPVRLREGFLPATLKKQGEQWEFYTDLAISMGWQSVLEIISRERPLKFKKGYFIIETAMQQHKVKIPKDIFKRIIELDKHFKSEREKRVRTY